MKDPQKKDFVRLEVRELVEWKKLSSDQTKAYPKYSLAFERLMMIKKQQYLQTEVKSGAVENLKNVL